MSTKSALSIKRLSNLIVKLLNCIVNVSNKRIHECHYFNGDDELNTLWLNRKRHNIHSWLLDIWQCL